MDLSHLSAHELALLDAVCLEFETRLRNGVSVSIDDLVRQHGGKNADLLQQELTAIAKEIQSAPAKRPIFGGDQTSASSGGFSTETPVDRLSEEDFRPDDTPTLAANASSLGGDEASRGNPAHAGGNAANTSEHDSAERSEQSRFTASTQQRMPAAGTLIGPYRLGEPLASGGMGTVYRAIDTRLNRTVAIKMLTLETSKRQELTERFEREAKAVAALSHPNIVELFDVGVSDHSPYAVMEYIDGPTLAQKMQQGTLPIPELREIGAQIAGALVAAHDGGVIHRDLKPQNIMLVPDGEGSHRIKLLDFGLSRALREDSDSNLGDVSSQTRAGTILGTPGYMSPEQARGDSATPATDIFGLGCILYEAFYGKPAIQGNTVADRFAATLNSTPLPDPIRRRDDVAFADLIQECLALQPDRRPEAATVLASLRMGVDNDSHANMNSHGGMQRRRFGVALIGGVAGLVGAAFWLSADHDELESIRRLAVLSFDDLSAEDTDSGRPLGSRAMTPGEKISATLVNELSRIDEIGVLPFRPLKVQSNESYQQLGKELNVDAFISGSLREDPAGDSGFVEVTLQIISATTGNQLWSETLRRPSGEGMLQHTDLASEVAQRIGQRLTPTSQQPAPPSAKHYNCLVDGKARADAESMSGLQKSLMCFQKAHQAAPDLVNPLAAIVSTSLTLAAQANESDAEMYMKLALENLQKAIQLRQNTAEFQLAQGMWEWQKLKHFEEAKSILADLAERQPYQWQVQHQLGLLLATLGEDGAARKHLQDAVLLNSMSLAVKVDRRRFDWFSGLDAAAVSGTKAYLDGGERDQIARGLLVDIFEQQGDLARAAEVLGWQEPILTPKSYFDRRSGALSEIPYGMFGDTMNQAILEIRMGRVPTEADLEEWQLGPFPMFPLLLARHPAFAPARLLPAAKQYLGGVNAGSATT